MSHKRCCHIHPLVHRGFHGLSKCISSCHLLIDSHPLSLSLLSITLTSTTRELATIHMFYSGTNKSNLTSVVQITQQHRLLQLQLLHPTVYTIAVELLISWSPFFSSSSSTLTVSLFFSHSLLFHLLFICTHLSYNNSWKYLVCTNETTKTTWIVFTLLEY